MPLIPVTFDDFSGGLVDLYIGTDTNRAAVMQNFLIDETKKAYVRYGTSIFPNRAPFTTGNTSASGIYLGPEPFSHPVAILGAHAFVANETATWTEIIGPNTSFLPTKTDAVRENGIIWRRQLVACAPVTGFPPSFIYSTNYVAPSNPANPATYKALTLGLPPLATAPTMTYSSSAAYIAAYAFFYKYTFIDYTGTLFAFFSNPNNPGFVQGSSTADPSSASIAISGIPVLANTALTNYDTSSQATTNTTFVAKSTTATVASATGIVLGAQLINANVVQGTVVTAISGTTITLSIPALTSATASSTIYATLTVQIYRTINGGSVFFYNGMVPNGTTTYTDAVSDLTLQVQQTIYTSGGALGYDQPPTNAFALTQTNDFFWYATKTSLSQSIQGAPGSVPSTYTDQIDQKIVGLSDVISFPILFCDKSVYRVEGTFDSFGNNGFYLREISKTAGCVSNASIVKTPYGLIWFGNGGIFATDGYNVTKITKHLNISYSLWMNSKVTGEYDPSRNMVYWTINTTSNPNGNNNAFLVLHLAYGLSEESVFTTLYSENNLFPTFLRFSLASDVSASDPLVTTTATWTSGLTTITVSSPSGIVSGQLVTGVGIPYGTYVQSISGSVVTLTQATNQNGSSTSLTFTQIIFSQLYSRMLFTDVNGYLLWFDPNSLADVLINTSLYPPQMAKKAIFYDYTTAGLDQGVKGFRKYTPDVVLEVDAQSPVAIQIRHRRDDGGGGWSGEGGSPPSGRGVAGSPGGGTTGNPGVPEIRQDGAITWAFTDCAWSTDSNEHLWNDFKTVSGKRSVPAAQLRSGRRQLKFCNSYTVIAGSDYYGTCTVTTQVGTNLPYVTLDNYPSQIWITDPEGYYITFHGDGYNQTFAITARISDSVLQLTDPYSLLIAGSQKWEIKGYRKFERPRILTFTLNAEVEGPTYGQATQPTGANSS
jgi:hypothetical protein